MPALSSSVHGASLSVCRRLEPGVFAENFTVCARTRVLSGWFPLFDDVGSLCATFVCATASPEQQRQNGRAQQKRARQTPLVVDVESPHVVFPGVFFNVTQCVKCF